MSPNIINNKKWTLFVMCTTLCIKLCVSIGFLENLLTSDEDNVSTIMRMTLPEKRISKFEELYIVIFPNVKLKEGNSYQKILKLCSPDLYANRKKTSPFLLNFNISDQIFHKYTYLCSSGQDGFYNAQTFFRAQRKNKSVNPKETKVFPLAKRQSRKRFRRKTKNVNLAESVLSTNISISRNSSSIFNNISGYKSGNVNNVSSQIDKSNNQVPYLKNVTQTSPTVHNYLKKKSNNYKNRNSSRKYETDSSNYVHNILSNKSTLKNILERIDKLNYTKLNNYKHVRENRTIREVKSVTPQIFGIRSDDDGVSYAGNTIELLANEEKTFRLFGEGFTQDHAIQFTAHNKEKGGRCDVSTSEVFQMEDVGKGWALVKIKLPAMELEQERWFVCMRNGVNNTAVHMGGNEWLTIVTYSPLLPMWVNIIILIILLCLSGIFSGLNLGLMALDKTELKIVRNTGTPTERKYAKAIEPVRQHGNFLLCTLLLGNVLVNSSLTILLDTLSSGLVAVIGSTIGIVIFGEIVPQAICSRHGLAIGAKTAWLVRIFMVLTGIVSWPISKILDLVLGEEIGNTYDRERLKELIKVTQESNDLRQEEQNMITGALEMRQKTAAEVMTKLEDVYMISVDSVLDFNTINDIMQQGYSRVPIYDGERTNIVSMLLIKDLAFIDPDDNTPVRTVTQFYQNSYHFFFEDTTLDVIFKEFKVGTKGHMAFVQHINNEGECDPFYEVVGLVTIEDIIEELIQEEIVDETDVITDNKSKRRRKHMRRDFQEFSHQNNSSERKVQISSQLQVATFQFLRTSVDAFKDGELSEGILKRLLNQDIIHVIKETSKLSPQKLPLYTEGKPADFFILILEGHVEVTVGKENLKFDSGPFTYFGLSALTLPVIGESPLMTQRNRGSIAGSLQSVDIPKFSFTPDYTVKVTGQVTFLKIRRSHYIAARRAYLVEQKHKDSSCAETFEKEIEKIIRDENEVQPSLNYQNKEFLANGGAELRDSMRSDQSVVIDIENKRTSRDSASMQLLLRPQNLNDTLTSPSQSFQSKESTPKKGSTTIEMRERSESPDEITPLDKNASG